MLSVVPVLLVTLVVLVCVVNVYLHQYLPNNNNNNKHQEEHQEEEEERCLALVRDLPDFSLGKMVHIGSSSSSMRNQDQHQHQEEDSSSYSSPSEEANCIKRMRNRKAQHPPPSFYFFLHVPRCAGRTLNFCLLKSVFPPKDRCLTSYKENSQLDKGALDKLGHACRVQGTHDDLSVLTQLPHKKPGIAVFTQIRNPVDRVLSAYEFSLQVATRYHFATKRKKNTNRTATDEVWPWLDLVPIMMESLARREEARKSLSSSLSKPNIWVRQHNASSKSFVYYNRVMNETREDLEGLDDGQLVLGDLDPYDNPLVMSLADFVKLPEVHDLLHNNQLYQLLGITNISKEPGLAKEIRRCCAGAAARGTNSKGTAATGLLLKRAERLVDDLWHVSVFDDLEGSHSSLCAASGWDLDQPSYKNGEKIVRTMRDKVDEMEGKEGSRLDQEKLLSDEYGRQNVSVREAVEKCVRQNREKKDVKNKVKFLRLLQDPYGRQILFSRENRAKISKDVLEYIRHHNQLDFELYEMAKSRYNLEEQQCKLNRDDATIDAKEK